MIPGRFRAPAPLRLAAARRAIGAADAGVLALAALRRRLVSTAALAKREQRQPLADPDREARVRRRAAWIGRALELPESTVTALLDLLIGDARRLQGLAPGAGPTHPCASSGAPEQDRMDTHMDAFDRPAAWLRLVPPPARWAPLLRRLPGGLQAVALEQAMRQALAALEADDALDALDGRRIGIEVHDLGLRWVVTRRDGRLCASVRDEPAEATVRGGVTDLLLLAARLEDADTLFFQRRLVLTGDTELGLTARNLLDRLPWERMPLALRIALNRLARLAAAARQAHRDRSPLPAVEPAIRPPNADVNA